MKTHLSGGRPNESARNLIVAMVGSLLLLAVPSTLAQSGTTVSSTQPPVVAKRLRIDDVLALARAGLSDQVIIAKLRQNNQAFNLSTDDLIRLKKANISDRVLAVMLNPRAETPEPGPSPAATPSTPPEPSKPPEASKPPERSTPTEASTPPDKPKTASKGILGSLKKAASLSLSNGGHAGTSGAAANTAVMPGDAVKMPPPDASPWDPRYGKMTGADLDNLGDAATRYDLMYLRLNPAALDQPAVMRYFIALNNCGNKEIERALFDELDYPALADFYKKRVSNILVPLPSFVRALSLYEPDANADASPIRDVFHPQPQPRLGEYNRQRRAFPVLFGNRQGLGISGEFALQTRHVLVNGCPAAAKAWYPAAPYFPADYTITLKPSTYLELPMDEDAARKYIDRTNGVRNIFLSMDVTVTGSPAGFVRLDGPLRFNAQASKITVMDQATRQPIGVLFDDGTVPAPGVKPPEQPKPQTNIWASADLQYEVRTSVFVYLAADACGWPLQPQQRSNLQTFLDQLQNTTSFYPKSYLGLATAEVRNEITKDGRVNFCADSAQRQKFDKAAASIAPRGPLGAPRHQ